MGKQVKDIFHSKVVAKTIPFEILTFEEFYERYSDQESFIYQYHRVQFNALFIIFSGEGTHHIDCKEYILKTGTIIPIIKDQVHFFNKQTNIEGILISFTSEFISHATNKQNLFHFLQLFNLPQLKIEPGKLHLLNPYIDLLFREQDNKSNNLKSDLLESILISLLIQVKKLTITEQQDQDSQRFLDFIHFKQLIITQLSATHNVKDLAEIMNVSYKYINDICKEFSNKTAKSFIDSWLLLEIKRNLLEKKYSIKEIAFLTGFEESSSLTRFFKKYTKKTPGEYLRNF